MAYSQTLYHIIFRTKYSEYSLNPKYSEELYRYIWGVIKNKNCRLLQINGIENHIHILSDLHPSVALADYIKDIKVSSNKWMKGSGNFPKFKGWAVGYCALTYSHKEKDSLIQYIKNQQEHHKKVSFKEEITELFKEFGIKEDIKWFWKD